MRVDMKLMDLLADDDPSTQSCMSCDLVSVMLVLRFIGFVFLSSVGSRPKMGILVVKDASSRAC